MRRVDDRRLASGVVHMLESGGVRADRVVGAIGRSFVVAF